ncbi:MAG: hypothetical protein ACRD3N_10885 [Terracidiphilus sp.]
MKPKKIGRALGIGLRVAGRVAGERLAGQGQAAAQNRQAAAQASQNRQAANTPAANPAARPASAKAAGQAAGLTSRGLARGVGGFLRPFGTVGRKLWLEIVGVFFLLPVLVFGPVLWKARASWEHGPDHRTFVVSAVVVVLFLYLGVSSFWRAWRK